MGNLIKIGGASAKVKVSLHVFGDDLEPDEITKWLGCSPTKAFRKGDIERNQLISKTGKWFLSIEGSEELEAVVEALLAKLTPDLDIWEDLVSRYRVDIFCGVFFESENNGNGGFSLSPQLMRELSVRGIEIGFDIYFA